MREAVFKCLIIANAIIGFNGWAWAQDLDFGKMAYEDSCAACHGKDGTGNGPLSQELKTRPPNLTILAKNNNGVFPVDRMYEIIDGRKSITSHGTREMPIWGNAFLSFGPENVVRSRIMAIIDYLNRIQVK
jgi:mono/diheme cytochrome c family protein